MSLLLPIILALHGAHAEKLSAPDAGSDQLFGCALAGGGDLDGDGYQYLAISAC